MAVLHTMFLKKVANTASLKAFEVRLHHYSTAPTYSKAHFTLTKSYIPLRT